MEEKKESNTSNTLTESKQPLQQKQSKESNYTQKENETSSKKVETGMNNLRSLGIKSWIQQKPEEKKQEAKQEKQPDNEFTNNQLKEYWGDFIQKIKEKGDVRAHAISICNLDKKTKNSILVCYPSEIAKSEFITIESEFLNGFKEKVQNFYLQIEYKKDEKLQREIRTKRKLFDSFAKENPILAELEDFMKFDLS